MALTSALARAEFTILDEDLADCEADRMHAWIAAEIDQPADRAPAAGGARAAPARAQPVVSLRQREESASAAAAGEPEPAPGNGVNVQIDPWLPEYDQEELPDIDPDADPNNPYNESRDEDLREAFGIETCRFWDAAVREMGVEETCEEIRRELGFGRPPWLHRMSGAKPSRVPPP
ncbi:MAG TPA: hypothetical protein VFY93_01635 [Planctomycetota bacterium]|nr:hypothetical protein [Planctomycetota bacterium]